MITPMVTNSRMAMTITKSGDVRSLGMGVSPLKEGWSSFLYQPMHRPFKNVAPFLERGVKIPTGACGGQQNDVSFFGHASRQLDRLKHILRRPAPGNARLLRPLQQEGARFPVGDHSFDAPGQ